MPGPPAPRARADRRALSARACLPRRGSTAYAADLQVAQRASEQGKADRAQVAKPAVGAGTKRHLDLPWT